MMLIMKKIYMKPEMQAIKIKNRSHLLVGSPLYMNVKEAAYDEGDMEDL